MLDADVSSSAAVDDGPVVVEADGTVAPPRPPNAHRPSPIELRLRVIDADVLAELRKQESLDARNAYALNALRIGALALRNASGQVDTSAMKAASEKLLAEVRELLTHRSQALTGELGKSLATYLDPATGALPQRLDSLLKSDGQLEKLLKAHLGPRDSVLAASLAQHLGEGSAIFKLLSPTDASGLRAQVQRLLESALGEQRNVILKEFSLDAKDSALSRLVGEISAKQLALSQDLRGQVDVVVNEFSLDKKDSALSRLVARVEAAQKQIAAEFTTDNDASALSRLSRMLGDASTSIEKNLTLDSQDSALSRLTRELESLLEAQAKKSTELQGAMLAAITELKAKKAADATGTRHGLDFEVRLGEFLTSEAQRLGDVYEQTGNTTGTIKGCKKGDHVIALGPDSAAPGARVVFEAKDSKAFTLKSALAEIEEARKNRGAQVGVFVFARRSAPEGLEAFKRYGDAIVTIWDDEDPVTDVYVRGAVSVARALCLRQTKAQGEFAEALQHTEEATRTIEKQAAYLDDIRKYAETSRSSAEKIIDRAERMRAVIEKQIDLLDDAVSALRASE